MNENETNAAPIVPPTSASGCSKSESDTPRTDTFYDDHLDFGHYESDEWHKFASQLERELSIAVAALKTIDEVEKFVEDVDSLLSCLIHRHRGTMAKIGEYEEIARLAAEARRVAPNPKVQIGGTL